MKKVIKIFFKVIIGMLSLLILFFLTTYWYITTEWKKFYTVEEIQSFVLEINASPEFSENFYNIYDKLYSNYRQKSLTKAYFDIVYYELIDEKRVYQTPTFVRAANILPIKSGMRDYPSFKLAWGLEKYCSSEKSFDFIMHFDNYQIKKYQLTNNNLKGYNLDLENLKNTTDILTFLVISKSTRPHRITNEEIKIEVDKLSENY